MRSNWLGMIDPDAAIRVRHHRPQLPSHEAGWPRLNQYSQFHTGRLSSPPAECRLHWTHRVRHVWQQVCVRACVRARVCVWDKRDAPARVNRPLTIIPDRLTRVARVHMTAKGASWARHTDHFQRFLPRPGCIPVGVELRLSPAAACRAVDPRPDYSSMGEKNIRIHRAEWRLTRVTCRIQIRNIKWGVGPAGLGSKWMAGWRIMRLAVRRVKKVASAAKSDESGLNHIYWTCWEKNKSKENPQRPLEAEIINTSPNIKQHAFCLFLIILKALAVHLNLCVLGFFCLLLSLPKAHDVFSHIGYIHTLWGRLSLLF